MRKPIRQLMLIPIVIAFSLSLSGQDDPNQNALATNQQVASEIPGVIKGGTKPEVIKTGMEGADDPIAWLNGELIFSEPSANRLLLLRRNGTILPFIENLHEPRGLAVDSTGRLISIQAQAGFTGIRIVYPLGKESVIADTFEGIPFSRPNDLVVDRKGGVYFTDPGVSAAQNRLPPAVYYVPNGGRAIRVADGIERPNGISLSPDEKTLYINNTLGNQLIAFDIQPDGTVRSRRNFGDYKARAQPAVATLGTPVLVSNADGLVVDDAGRLYALTSAGIEVFSAQGQHLGIIPVTCTPSGGRCQGLAFGGDDKKTLYVAGTGSLLRIPMLAQGLRGRVK